MAHILLVDDDAALRTVLRMTFGREQFQISEASDGVMAWRVLDLPRNPQKIDFVILDVLMPHCDGIELCRKIRQINQQIPILFLSSQQDEVDRILGLELGGDDYLSKPFSPREVLARTKAILRRTQNATIADKNTHLIQQFGLTLDTQNYLLHYKDQKTRLTSTELGILRTLMSAGERVLSRDMLMQQAYDLHKIVEGRTIDSHMRRVRQKLQEIGAPNAIETLHGVGYRWVLGEAL